MQYNMYNTYAAAAGGGGGNTNGGAYAAPQYAYAQQQQQQQQQTYPYATHADPASMYAANAGIPQAATATAAAAAPQGMANYATAAAATPYTTAPQQPQQQQPQQQQQQAYYYGNYDATPAAPQLAAPAAPPPAPPAREAVDDNGLRWVWSTYPTTVRRRHGGGGGGKEHGGTTAAAATTAAATTFIPLPEMVVPLACVYTPLKPIDVTQLVLGNPDAQGQRCTYCGAYWCVHCPREDGRYWVCMACLRHNRVPPSYSLQHPALVHETVEYVLPSSHDGGDMGGGDGVAERTLSSAAAAATQPPPCGETDEEASNRACGPVYIFVVDTCLPSDELAALKAQLLRCLEWLPPRALVGLITFAARACVWEVGTTTLSRCCTLRGDTAHSPSELADMLQVSERRQMPVRGRYVAPLSQCEFALASLIDELHSDVPAVPSGTRPLRATAPALEAATLLLEHLRPHVTPASVNAALSAATAAGGGKHGGGGAATTAAAAALSSSYTTYGRVLLFTGGPCTRGVGAVVSTDKAQMMRSHRDIMDGDTPLYDTAHTFYNQLGARLTSVHACLDVFAQSFDQVGVMEMRHCINDTGGTMICGDAFAHEHFAISLERYFERCGLRAQQPQPQQQQQQQSPPSPSSLLPLAATAGTGVAGVHKDGSVATAATAALPSVPGEGAHDAAASQRASAAAMTGNNNNNGSMSSATVTSHESVVHCGFAVTMELYTSANTLISGVLGPCVSDATMAAAATTSSNNNNSSNSKGGGGDGAGASPIHIGNHGSSGAGGCTRWRVSVLDQGVTYAYVFDTATLEPTGGSDGAGGSGAATPGSGDHAGGGGGVSGMLHRVIGRAGSEAGNNSAAAAAAAAAASASSSTARRFVQFVTRYLTPDGQRRVRVTSVVQPTAPATAPASYYIQHRTFDATCAATVIARMAVSILEKAPSRWSEVKRWVDTLLVHFVRRYGTYTAGQPTSLRMDPSCALLPSFMFNLRRSEYFMVLNISPDETTYKRHWLMRESVDNGVLMIQPTLDAYNYDNPYATAVPLDSSSLRDDNIVLMDAFFNTHIMWGSLIYEWIKAGYQEQPEHAYFAELLENVEADAQAILAVRYPYPRFSRTDANGSEARHIKTRVNPTTTYKSLATAAAAGGGHGVAAGAGAAGAGGASYAAMAGAAATQADLIYTDDASIAAFMQSLQRAVTMQDAGKSTASGL